MNKVVSLCAVACMTMVLASCGDSGEVESDFPSVEAVSPPTSSIVDSTTSEATPVPEEKLFDSNEIVNSFLEKYNETAEHPFGADEIEKGNVRNKAIISTGDLYINIWSLDQKNGISISIEDKDEPSEEFFPVFRDCLKAIDESVTDEQAAECWEELQSLNYSVDINDTGMETPCMVNGIRTGYLHSDLYGEMSRADILYYAEE